MWFAASSHWRGIIISVAFTSLASCVGADRDGASNGIEVVAFDQHYEPCVQPSRTDISESYSEYAEFPCRIIAIPTSVVLRPSLDGHSPDPNPGIVTEVVRDNSGRIYTTSLRGAPVYVWDSLGQYLTTIGRKGAGPGEFNGWPLSLLMDHGDTLHVLDGSGRWNVFDPGHKNVRSFSTAVGFRSVSLIAGGPIVFTTPVPWGETQAVFHRVTLDGKPDGSYGRNTESNNGNSRLSSASVDGSVWIASAPGTGTGFVLENFSMDGARRSVINRAVPWLPLTGYQDEPRLPSFRVLNADAEGLLWVAIGVKDPRWYPRKPGESASDRERVSATLYDLRFEVLDPSTGRVLASVRYDDVDEAAMPPIYPVGHGSRLVWGSSADSLGQSTLSIYSLQLVNARK